MPFTNATPVMIYSGALQSRKTFYVYTPPGYEQGEEKYPVLYLLHGMWGNETDWIYKGKAVETIRALIEKKVLPPSIVVFPNDGEYHDGTFYVDWYDGTGRFEEYFIYDVVRYVDRHYRTSDQSHQRGIAGLSMGGYGALVLALRHPDLFGAAASMSGAVGQAKPESQSFVSRMVGPIDGPYAKERNLTVLTLERFSQGKYPRLYVDCGQEDSLHQDNLDFKEHLDAIGYPVEFHTFPGAHTWKYWEVHLVDVCGFMAKSFQVQ